MAFTEEQMQRYSRHLILKGVGVKGQQKLIREQSVSDWSWNDLARRLFLYLTASGVGNNWY